MLSAKIRVRAYTTHSWSIFLLVSITAVPAGLYLARNKSLVAVLIDALFDTPIVMPPLIVGVLLLSFFNLPLIKGVYDFIFTMPGAIMAQFFVAMPFTTRAAKSGFELDSPVIRLSPSVDRRDQWPHSRREHALSCRYPLEI